MNINSRICRIVISYGKSHVNNRYHRLKNAEPVKRIFNTAIVSFLISSSCSNGYGYFIDLDTYSL